MEDYDNYESDSSSVSSFESENLKGRGRRGRPRKYKGKAMTGAAMTGAGATGAGFLSDLGIPIISNLAGAVGLGRRGRPRKHKGMGATGAAMAGAGATGAGFLSDLGIPVVSQLAGAIGLGKRKYKGRAMTGAGATGAGFLSDLGIPIISNIAGAIGLGKNGKPVFVPHGGAFSGAAFTGGEGRSLPRSASQNMLNQRYQLAKFRASQMPEGGVKKGGYVHRPAHYRGVGAGATGAGEYADDYMGGAFTGGMTRKLLGRPVGSGRRRGRGKMEDEESENEVDGEGFWDDFKQGFMSVVKPVAGIAKSALPLLGPEGMAASGVLNAVGLGKRGRKPKRAMKAHDGRKARAEIVKQVMRQRGVSLAEASKIVKNEGLY